MTDYMRRYESPFGAPGISVSHVLIHELVTLLLAGKWGIQIRLSLWPLGALHLLTRRGGPARIWSIAAGPLVNAPPSGAPLHRSW
jgi:hypothetical protein